MSEFRTVLTTVAITAENTPEAMGAALQHLDDAVTLISAHPKVELVSVDVQDYKDPEGRNHKLIHNTMTGPQELKDFIASVMDNGNFDDDSEGEGEDDIL